MNSVGKDRIKTVGEAIATYFRNSLDVEEAGMEIIEAGDAALVLAKTLSRPRIVLLQNERWLDFKLSNF